MNSTPQHDTTQLGVSMGSVHTLASKTVPLSSDPHASKRVCFYKSGDPQFNGQRMVINSRTFKTFDALLDALSKKVPLPFGVRTVTTPRGTHTVRALEELQDGASYVCSDQRRVKPLNLEEVHRRQVPWNTPRPVSAGRQARRAVIRQLVKRGEVGVRAAKMTDNSVTVRTPKRLIVFKNRDPTVRRIVVLNRRSAPTFDALLDYLSQVLQFPVVKLYTSDGRRVEGLPGLILCSDVVVAAGNEHFRPGNYDLQGPSQPAHSSISGSMGPIRTQPQLQTKKSLGSSVRSRNFSLSSERYFVSQINNSLNGSLYEQNGQKSNSNSVEMINNQRPESENMETSDCMAGIEEGTVPICMPAEDDIEKSFRVNQDGSMTVEMKVRLTIKQEEMIHWTTTLSRTLTGSQERTVCSSQTGSGPDSLDNKIDPTRKSRGLNRYDESCSTPHENNVMFNEVSTEYCGSSAENLETSKPTFRRLPTPGPRSVRRKATSVESIKRVSDTEVQENTVGAYSYMERTAEGELTEGYCVVSRRSSSTRPVPKPRRTESNKVKHSQSYGSLRSPGVAEVLQLNNNGVGITETMLHIRETQEKCVDYFASSQTDLNKGLSRSAKIPRRNKLGSTDSGPSSSTNDCDVDLTGLSTSSDSLNGKKNEILSLSSRQSSPQQKISNSLSSFTDNRHTETHTLVESKSESTQKEVDGSESVTKEGSEDKNTESKKKRTPKTAKSKKSISSTTPSSDKRQKGSVSSSLKDVKKIKSPDSLSHTGSVRKTLSTAESDRRSQRLETHKKKIKQEGDNIRKSKSLTLNIGNQKVASLEKELNLKDAINNDTTHNINTNESNTLRPPIKKNILDILPSSHSGQIKRTFVKQKSMNETRTKSPKQNWEMSESASVPTLHSLPNVYQYVENWLEKMQPDSVPYMEETVSADAENKSKPMFQLGCDSSETSDQNSEPEKCNAPEKSDSLEDNTVERPLSRPPVQIRCDGEPVEEHPQRLRAFCKSMPSVRIQPAEEESRARMHKSTEALAPVERETLQNTKLNIRSGVKPVLEQLCLSIQSIRRASNHTRTENMGKSCSLPDFSSHVASAFGSPSKALLSFLSVMTLRDGISSVGGDESRGSNADSGSEALQVMQSLEKIATIEDEEALRASLTSLRSSTSSKLQQSWKDFQERNDLEESPPPSPRNSEQEFALEVSSEGEDQNKSHSFGIEQLMEELNMSDDLRREISSLVEGDNSYDKEELPEHSDSLNSHSDRVTKDIDRTATPRTLEEAAHLEKERQFSEERASQEEDIAEGKQADTTSEVSTLPPNSPESEKANNDLLTEELESHGHTSEIEDNVHRTGSSCTEEGQSCVEDQVLEGDDENVEETKCVLNSSFPEEDVSLEEESAKQGQDDSTLSEVEEYELDRTPVAELETTSLDRKDSVVSENRETVAESEITEEPDGYEESNSQAEKKEVTGSFEQSDMLSSASETEYAEAQHHSLLSEADFKKQDTGDSESNKNDSDTGDVNEIQSAPFTEGGVEHLSSNEEENIQESPESECDNKDAKSYHSEQEPEDSLSESHRSQDPEDSKEEQVSKTISPIDDENSYTEEQDSNELEDNEHAGGTPASLCEDVDEIQHSELGAKDSNKEKPEPWISQDSETEQERQLSNQSKATSQVHSHDDSFDGSEKGRCNQSLKSEASACEDVDAELQHYSISEPEAKNSESDRESESCETLKSYSENVVHKLTEANDTMKQHSSAEDNYLEDRVEKMREVFVKSDHELIDHGQEQTYNSESENKDSVKTEPELCKSQDRERNEEWSNSAGVTDWAEDDSCFIHPSVEITQELLDCVNSALMSSTLTFTRDPSGNLRIEPKGLQMKKALARTNANGTYGQRRLPSPNTSDLSDYRSDISDTGSYQTQDSLELLTDSGEDNVPKISVSQRNNMQGSEKSHIISRAKENGSMKPNSGSKHHDFDSPGTKSNISPKSCQDSMTKHTNQNHINSNSSSSISGESELVQRILSQTDPNEGVLIDKGRWLLKENHLIRKSPPVPMGMYGNADTTSADTGQENTSEDVPYSHFQSQPSPMAVISSSELEDMAKPPTPKCTYFNMVHGSDSDPFQDDQSINSRKGISDIKRSRELKVSPVAEPSKMWARKNGSLSSFASVDLKMPDGKVHPEGGAVVEPPTGEKPTHSQRIGSQALREEDTTERLNLRCGQYCPIL
ncbi:oxygen-regulated protein 1 [Chanos chanos]|uniref:Oxygen-regulated protein 1 n=1 Tax=Chanos chanos TaxID=29144 RepID=A0A6J2VF69_CHACN|nr:oxygen-regulated protein 1-like [Chanos chanos]